MSRLELQNGGIFPENYSHIEVPLLATRKAFKPENPHVKAYCRETDLASSPELNGTYQWGTAAPGNSVTLTSITLERLL